MTKLKKILISIAALVLLGGVLLCGSAEAVLNGSAFYSGVGGFSATVNWSVYAPGEAGGLSGTDYSYMYTIINTSTATSANDIWAFAIGNPSAAPISSWGSLPNGGIPPTFFPPPQPGGTQVIFYTPPIPSGLFSEILFLTSPYGPIWVDGGLQALGGATDTQIIRGPGGVIPEPTSMLLFGMGILGLLRLKRKT